MFLFPAVSRLLFHITVEVNCICLGGSGDASRGKQNQTGRLTHRPTDPQTDRRNEKGRREREPVVDAIGGP